MAQSEWREGLRVRGVCVCGRPPRDSPPMHYAEGAAIVTTGAGKVWRECARGGGVCMALGAWWGVRRERGEASDMEEVQAVCRQEEGRWTLT